MKRRKKKSPKQQLPNPVFFPSPFLISAHHSKGSKAFISLFGVRRKKTEASRHSGDRNKAQAEATFYCKGGQTCLAYCRRRAAKHSEVEVAYWFARCIFNQKRKGKQNRRKSIGSEGGKRLRWRVFNCVREVSVNIRWEDLSTHSNNMIIVVRR